MPFNTGPSDNSIKNATKAAIVLLVRDNEYVKFVYRSMLSLNHAAKAYNIKLPDVLTEDCVELNEYNKIYDLLKQNGKINPSALGNPEKFVDIERFKQIYQPIYNRAICVCDKYPMIYRAIMTGILRVKPFLENDLIVLDYSAKKHFANAESNQAESLFIHNVDSMLDLCNWIVPKSFISPVLHQLPGEYIAEHYDVPTGVIIYTGKIYFEMYPERLFEYMWELPDIYETMHNGLSRYNLHECDEIDDHRVYEYKQDNDSIDLDSDFDINSMLSDQLTE